MVNTYSDDAPMEVKMFEEARCLRAVLERILRVMDEGLFVDYQMEKFGKSYKTQIITKTNLHPCHCKSKSHFGQCTENVEYGGSHCSWCMKGMCKTDSKPRSKK